MHQPSGAKASEDLRPQPPNLGSQRGAVRDQDREIMQLSRDRPAEAEMPEQSVISEFQTGPYIRPVIPVKTELVQQQTVRKKHKTTQRNEYRPKGKLFFALFPLFHIK